MIAKVSPVKIAYLYLIAILFVIFDFSNIKIAGINGLIPLFDMMMVFYFAIFKRVFPLWFIFLLGIWSDALNGNPLGTTSLCYIIIVKSLLMLKSKMVAEESFPDIWRQFIIFTISFLLIKWSILSIVDKTAYSVTFIFIQAAISIIFYIFMHRFFDYLSEKIFGC